MRKKRPKIWLIKRQQIWTLTPQGWVMAIATTAMLIVFTITHTYPFLAVTSPIKADALVVEGWISDDALKQAAAEFASGSYSKIITTGIPVSRGFYLVEYKNFAEIAAATFRKLGIQEEKLAVVPSLNVIKDRTYGSAVAVRQWLLNSHYPLKSINLFTSDAHARRSWLIYKNIFAPKMKVGVIAAQPDNYNPKKWWTSSEGVRTVISETIAYLYALFVNQA